MGELAVGMSARDRARWDALLSPFHVLASTVEVGWHYGQAYRHLHDNGSMIGANDLWIAATGLAYRMPVVTANPEHFRRVPGLEVESY